GTVERRRNSWRHAGQRGLRVGAPDRGAGRRPVRGRPSQTATRSCSPHGTSTEVDDL
ncbi:MAG: hypothetical protein AVDCRST_MAG19-2927, partial [uncultured Thermomicrobiales bacterium]